AEGVGRDAEPDRRFVEGEGTAASPAFPEGEQLERVDGGFGRPRAPAGGTRGPQGPAPETDGPDVAREDLADGARGEGAFVAAEDALGFRPEPVLGEPVDEAPGEIGPQ